MNTYKLSEIEADKVFESEVLLDPLFLIEPADVPIDRSVIAALTEWEFSAVCCDKALPPPPPPNADKGAAAKKKIEISTATEDVSLDDFMSDEPKKPSAPEKPTAPASPAAKVSAVPPPPPAQKSAAGNSAPLSPDSKAKAQQSGALNAPRRAPSEAAQIGASGAQSSAAKTTAFDGGGKERYSEEERLEAVKKTYAEYEDYITALFTRYATHGEMNTKDLSNKVHSLCAFIKDNQRYMLRIVPSDDAHRGNMFVSHSMRSTVLAITIGIEMRLSESRLEELGIACLIHEIGMLRLPPQIYVTHKMLTTSERILMETHCTQGAAIAGVLGFGDNIKNGIADHHECKNGMGYPNRKMGDRISMYGKIIAVACSYEAITAPRQYKAERSAFEAMVEMLKNKEQRYDDTVIKSLLYSLSLFPIGAFVFLSDGRIGQVTDVNPTDPQNPIVQLLNEKNASGEPLAIQTDAAKNKIVRVLSRNEIYDAIKSMKR